MSATRASADRLKDLEDKLIKQEEEMNMLRLVNAPSNSQVDVAALVDALASRHLLAGPPHRTQEVRVSTQLKRPDIERFAGDREKTVELVMAMNDCLETTGQASTPAGLEFAVAHLECYAASWWRAYRVQYPVHSWLDLKPALERAFEMVDAQRVYEKRLFALTQTGTVQEYVDDFLSISVRLPLLDDAFKQRRFSDGACSYLQEKFAGMDFPTLLEMVHYTLRLVATVNPRYFTPDSSVEPVVAAVAAKGGRSDPRVKCYRCGRQGHLKENCYPKLDNKSKPEKKEQHKHQSRRPTRPSANFGKYDGSGRVNAVEADAVSCVDDEISDDDLRQGNDLA